MRVPPSVKPTKRKTTLDVLPDPLSVASVPPVEDRLFVRKTFQLHLPVRTLEHNRNWYKKIRTLVQYQFHGFLSLRQKETACFPLFCQKQFACRGSAICLKKNWFQCLYLNTK